MTITSKDLDRGNALTGVARQEAEKIEAEERSRLIALQAELELERAVVAELEKGRKAKSKKASSGKKKK